MRKYLLLLILINFSILAYNQVLKGNVLDKLSDQAIKFAFIYFNGTFVGTQSDQNGYFELDIAKNISMPLTISALGYYSATLIDFPTEKPLIIHLTPKVFELKEVVITAKANAKARRANLKLFKNAFLGTTLNARNCEITNENDIILYMDSVNDTLKAFSSKPIQIDNLALGYKILYYLDKFEYSTKNNSFFFRGNIIFNEDLAIKKTQKQRFERRRKNAYLGSRMHFFRELWKNNLDSSGFKVNDTFATNIKLTYYNFVIPIDRPVASNSGTYISYQRDIGISYYTKMPKSLILFQKRYVFFNKYGYFDPSGISWYGEMAKQRIADWLPYEYSIK
jgi:hypothetical protein